MNRSRGSRFLAAFNEVEDHFRSVLGPGTRVDFGQMARDYGERKHLPRRQLDALAAFAGLRNAISHGRYYDGRPIADPVGEIVEQIERLRDQLLSPPLAISILGSTEVRSVRPEDPISVALDFVRAYDYSQFPVYSADGYTALLTTNAVARWLANQLRLTGGLAESESVEHVLRFAEPHELALLAPRTITVPDAMHRLAHGGVGGRSVPAVLITQTGRVTEMPLALLVADDLPTLSEALEIV